MTPMKKKLLLGLLYVALGYLSLVALYFIYLELGGSGGNAMYAAEHFKAIREDDSFASSSVRNYATVKFEAMQTAQAVEQKYEKIASIHAATKQFDSDEQQARAAVKEHNALIQEEAIHSDDGLRWLQLTIGVPPEHFDAIVTVLKKIGEDGGYQITKTDKTNEYLELKAKRTTLEKTRDALVDLKKQSGKIEELVKLEQEILDIEGKIQEFGVQLGQFDKENEFCTVRFSLSETHKQERHSSHLGYLVESLQWASTVYLALLGIAFMGLLCVVLVLVILEKSKIFRADS